MENQYTFLEWKSISSKIEKLNWQVQKSNLISVDYEVNVCFDTTARGQLLNLGHGIFQNFMEKVMELYQVISVQTL